MNEPMFSVVQRRGGGGIGLALGCAAVLMAAVPPSGRAQGGENLATLQARSKALDDELGREMRRLQVYLNYVDQTLAMQGAQGQGPGAKDLPGQLAKIATALYQRSYTDSDLATRVAEHGRAGEAFFQFVEKQIAAAGRWPAGRSPAEYRALAQTELQAVRAQFAALRADPAGFVPILSRAAKTLGWTRGGAAVSDDRNPFAQSAERVIGALTEEHGRQVVGLSQGTGRSAAVAPTPAAIAGVPGSTPGASMAVTAAVTGAATADFSQLLAGANQALSQSNTTDARRLFELAAQAKGDSVEAFLGLGRCANFEGDLDGAMKAYLAAARLAPDTPNLRVWIAEVFIGRGNFRSAQQWLDTELKMQPASAWAWSWRGTLQLETGDRAAAVVAMARAAALQPETSSFRFQNGAALLNSNQPKRALMDFTAALMIDPRGTGAYYQLAECHARLGERDQAIENFRRYLQSDSTSVWAVRARARIEELSRAR